MKRAILSTLFLLGLINLFVSFKHDIIHHSVSSYHNDSIPKPLGIISDFENVIDDKDELELIEMAVEIGNKTGAQLAIVSIFNYFPETNLASYSTKLFNTWGIGHLDKNDGVLIIFGKTIREVRIATGKGIEALLTDEECKQIIDYLIIPEFKKGEVFQGLKNALNAISTELS
jgi:uncharacterized protein